MSAPLLWLALGLLVAAAALVVGLLTASTTLAIVAWTLGGPGAIALLGVFIQQDTSRRANPWYAENGVTAWGRRLLVLLSLVAVAVAAWTIADHLSRRGS